MFTPFGSFQQSQWPTMISQVGQLYSKNPQLAHSLLKTGKNWILNPSTSAYYYRGGDDDYEYYHKPHHPKPGPPPPPNVGGLFGMGTITSFLLGGIAGYALTQINQPASYPPPPPPYQPMPYQPLPYQPQMAPSFTQQPQMQQTSLPNSMMNATPSSSPMNQQVGMQQPSYAPYQTQVITPPQQTQMLPYGYQTQTTMMQTIPRPTAYQNGYPYPYYDTIH